MTQMIAKANLKIAAPLVRFIEECALPGIGIEPAAFWVALTKIYAKFEPQNAALLSRRDQMQAKIDGWHQARSGQPIDQAAYQGFLQRTTPPRACAISDNGHYACANGTRPKDTSMPPDPKERALQICTSKAGQPCILYAVDNPAGYRPGP